MLDMLGDNFVAKLQILTLSFCTFTLLIILHKHSNFYLNWISVDTQVKFLWTETLNYFRYICLKLRLLMFTV